MTHITIIGGGITGLATAFYLQKKRDETNLPITYTLLESSSRMGGTIVTDYVDRFVVEGGPDSFITQKPGGLQLCRDLGITDRLIPTNTYPRNVFVLRNSKLIPFPAGYRLAIPTEFMPFALSPLISPIGKLRMGLDLVIPKRTETGDESLASFIRRRLGQEALDMIGEPLMAGIYNADPEQLSIQSTFPMFTALEQKHGSLIKAMQVAKKQRPQPPKNGANKPAAMFNSLQGGMQELVDSLVNQLTGELCLNSPVHSMTKLETGFKLSIENQQGHSQRQTDMVVMAVPASNIASLVRSVSTPLTDELQTIAYTSTATISLGFRRADIHHDLNGYGFVIPKQENRQILACTWSSSKFNHRADDDHVLIRVFVGGLGQEHILDLSDDSLVTLARVELLALMNISAKPVMYRIFRWRQARPQYNVGHLDKVLKMETLAAQIPGLYLTGSSFRGIGIPDCVKTAQATVEQICQQLT